MRRETQILPTVAVVATAGIGTLVVIRQQDQVSQQQRALDQQANQAKALQDRSEEAERLRKQEAIHSLQPKALVAEQASQANSAQRSMERQQLMSQIQDLKIQRAQLVHQANCNKTQMGIKNAGRSDDTSQARALQERWNANCAS